MRHIDRTTILKENWKKMIKESMTNRPDPIFDDSFVSGELSDYDLKHIILKVAEKTQTSAGDWSLETQQKNDKGFVVTLKNKLLNTKVQVQYTSAGIGNIQTVKETVEFSHLVDHVVDEKNPDHQAIASDAMSKIMAIISERKDGESDARILNSIKSVMDDVVTEIKQ